MVVTNSGPAVAANVVVRDPYSSELQYQSGTVSGGNGSCNANNNVAMCSLGSMNAGETRTITLTFGTQQSASYGSYNSYNGACFPGFIQNVSMVSSDTLDGNYANNQSQTVSTEIRCNNVIPPQYQQPTIIYNYQYQAQTQTANPTVDVDISGVTFPQTGAEDDFYAPLAGTNAVLKPYASASNGTNVVMGVLTAMMTAFGFAAAGVTKGLRFFV